jgi:hypothetical protein
MNKIRTISSMIKYQFIITPKIPLHVSMVLFVLTKLFFGQSIYVHALLAPGLQKSIDVQIY